MEKNKEAKKQRSKSKDVEQIANFVYEAGALSKTPRSGLWFLGSGTQSVAEHLLRTSYIAYALCHLTPAANKNRVIFLALMHDIGEGRTSDLNYVHQRYGRLAEAQAVKDIATSVPFGEEIKGAYEEEQARASLEAKLAKDADNLEWISTLREEEVKGNIKARSWIEIAEKRLKTEAGQAVGARLLKTHPDAWWFDEKDKWFVTRAPSEKPWKTAEKNRKRKK
ncbi:MAG: HD domain-containing protein [Parcubacteria group bacterium]|nr:HD domain-containing protein [Parcubacteria group bacterium]MBI2049145.1 HD domain-containing protein [Parcubacteria group bacterium]